MADAHLREHFVGGQHAFDEHFDLAASGFAS
jgi:hypothetical protein